MDITGTSALVSGPAPAAGAPTAAALAARGAEVIGMDLPASIVNATPPPGVTLVAADVTEDAPVRAALDRLGAAPLRIAVSCAGIAPSTCSTPCSRSTCSARSTCCGWPPR